MVPQSTKGNNMSFEEFMKRCDIICSSRLGLGVHDLEDWRWMDAYRELLAPAVAVQQFLEDIEADF